MTDGALHEVPMDLGEHHDPNAYCWCRPRKFSGGLRHRPHWETVAYLEWRLETVSAELTDARAQVEALEAECDVLLDRLEAAEEEIVALERTDNVVSIDR